jgi:hypothetical protein
VADNGWQRKFENPIPLPDGHKLVTLHDAATYITALSKRKPPSRNGKPQSKR